MFNPACPAHLGQENEGHGRGWPFQRRPHREDNDKQGPTVLSAIPPGGGHMVSGQVRKVGPQLVEDR
jgi:hypothetical protein